MWPKTYTQKSSSSKLSAKLSSRGTEVVRRYSLQRQSQPTIVSANNIPDRIHAIKATYKREERGELRGQLAFRHDGRFQRIKQGVWKDSTRRGKRGNNTRENIYQADYNVRIEKRKEPTASGVMVVEVAAAGVWFRAGAGHRRRRPKLLVRATVVLQNSNLDLCLRPSTTTTTTIVVSASTTIFIVLVSCLWSLDSSSAPD